MCPPATALVKELEECADSAVLKEMIGRGALRETATTVANHFQHFGSSGCFFDGVRLYFSLTPGADTDIAYQPVCRRRDLSGRNVARHLDEDHSHSGQSPREQGQDEPPRPVGGADAPKPSSDASATRTEGEGQLPPDGASSGSATRTRTREEDADGQGQAQGGSRLAPWRGDVLESDPTAEGRYWNGLIR